MMHARFAATIFASAVLLFSCQPMIARMIVPLLGGAPSVWIVCSLCFQTLLLLGYAYAHFIGTRFTVRAQVILQLALVGTVFLVMPISVAEAEAASLTARWPTLGILILLLRTIGLPFFVLSTSSPLLQRWFAELGEKDPYHLYVASNAGSMIALLGYPFVVEPLLSVRVQSRALHAGFAIYSALVVLCAIAAVKNAHPARIDTTDAPPSLAPPSGSDPPAARWRERLVWIALAFAPSSLLLGATTYVTTDIASVPLLWVLPLALYLASFIFAFAKKQIVAPGIVSRALALVVALVSALMLFFVARPVWLIVGGHMLLLFLGSVICHRALAERRPHVSRLTEFYLLMSVGGVLGGVFNGIVAPMIFRDLFEYPLAIGFVCLGRAAAPGSDVPNDRPGLVRDAAFGVGVGLVAFALVWSGVGRQSDPQRTFVWMFGLPLLGAFAWSKRPVRYAFAITGLLLAGMSHGGMIGKTIFGERNFFGVLKVTREYDGRARLLVSGRTMHGRQALDPAGSRIPLAYYHPSGPAGDVLGPLPPAPLPEEVVTPRRVGVVGLGIGTLAAYARMGDRWTFFEIDPAVVEVAREQFSYLSDAEKVAKIEIEVGDARLRLRDGAEDRFDVLVVDAFSSDAIPVHLVTREALAIYRRSLRPGGVLLVHISNLHVNLEPVFAALAREASLYAIVRRDPATPAAHELGKEDSEWVVLTDSLPEIVRVRAIHAGWHLLEAPPSQRVWTDDFANVLGAMRF